MDWRTKVELYEEIRREYEFGSGTIAGVAKKLKVHRRMVRDALASALPARRRNAKNRSGKLKAYYERIDKMLEADRGAPRKQRHTARRIWNRLRAGRRVRRRGTIGACVCEPAQDGIGIEPARYIRAADI